MSDKDQFTFEDEDDFSEALMGDKEESPKFDLGDDDFPETDLSAAFSDGEHEAENPAPDVVEDPEPKKAKGLFGRGKSDKPKKEKKPKKAKKEKTPKPKKEKKAGGGSSSRILLLVLLLVVAGGAGAYFFMDLGGTTPSVPTVPAPAKKVTKAVVLPPKPAQAPVPAKPPAPAKAPTEAKDPVKPASVAAKAPAPKPQVQPADKAKPVTVAVPPPPKPAVKPVPKPVAAKPAPAVKPEAPVPAKVPSQKTVVKPQTEPVKMPVAKASVPAPKPAATTQPQAAGKATATPTMQKSAEVTAPAATPEKTVASVKQVVGGAYALDAGSYLLETNRKTLVAKIKKLGYEPLITPVDARLDMTRLRLGTFSKTEVKEALAFARSIEPGSYSSPAGDGYVIYAGTFLKSANVEKLKQRFLDEGIKARPEPVEVVRTLSRIRFGSFATKNDAAAAAVETGKAGVKAVVVKSK